jgi:hypothetical protein
MAGHRSAQNRTPPVPAGLTPAQDAALAALLMGCPVTAAAETAGVRRETVHAWLREPGFQAAYNAGRADLLEATTGRLLALADRATALVESAIDNAGDVKMALAVLKGLGVLSGSAPVIGPTDAQGVENEQVAAKLKVGDRSLNRLLASIGE